MAWQAVGVMMGAYERALAYVKERDCVQLFRMVDGQVEADQGAETTADHQRRLVGDGGEQVVDVVAVRRHCHWRTDPADRRRLLIWPATEASERVAEILSTSVDDTIAAALGTDDPLRITEVVAALELLAGRLSPESLTRPPLRSESGRNAP